MTDSAPRRTLRFRCWWPVLLLLLLAGGGIVYWHFRQPPTMRLIARIPAYDILPDRGAALIHRSAAGFLLLDAPLPEKRPDLPVAVTFYDWRGQVQWRVQVPGHDLRHWRTSNDCRPPSWSYGTRFWSLRVSPDGHYLATALVQGTAVHVYTWRDGVPAGDAVIPIAAFAVPDGHAPFDCHVDNTGEVLLWVPDTVQDAPLFLVTGTTVLRGMHHSKLPRNSGHRYIRYLAPDHRTLIGLNYPGSLANGGRQGPFEYATLAPTGPNLQVIYRYQQQRQYADNATWVMCPYGYAVTERDVYGPQGKITSLPGVVRDYDPVAGNLRLYNYNYEQYILIPITRQMSWANSSRVRYALMGIDNLSNTYAVRFDASSLRSYQKSVAPLVNLGIYKRWHALRKPIRRIYEQPLPQWCMIYRNPDILKARLATTFVSYSFGAQCSLYTEYRRTRNSIKGTMVLSPDGHTIVVPTYSIRNMRGEWLVYGW